jgi:nucleotide-binding universal stress UspA family protein
MTIARISCPTDFSDASAHAIDLAVAMARWYNARIAAIHVIDAGVSVPEKGISSSHNEADLSAIRARMASSFSSAANAGVEVDLFVEAGPPAARILESAAALPADLIVIGTHGTAGFHHLVLGSVTERVLRKAACPVLTVPPRAQSTAQLPFRRLLCAIDFSDSALHALQFAVSLAKESDARLTLLHVLEWPWEEPPSPNLADLPAEQGAALAEYRRYRETMALTELEKTAGLTRLAHSPTVLLRNGKPYRQILDVARDEGSDLIVIGVQGRTPMDIMFFGSTANQVVRRASCPVLTIRLSP